MKKKVFSLLLAVVFAMMNFNIIANATCAYGIKNNGLGGIYIDINSEPYTTFATYSYGYNAYTSVGCAWYASARVNDLTGKGSIIRSASNWWNNGESYGFTKSSTPVAGSIICVKSSSTGGEHVAILEKIEGSTAYISEGGYGSAGADYGYCIIRTVDVSKIASQYASSDYGGYDNFLGYMCMNTGAVEPTAELTIDKTKINPNDSITFNFSGENVSNVFTLGIYKDSERVDTIDVTGNTYTYFFSEEGSYSAYMTSYNNYGFADSNWVYWNVGQVTAELKINKAEYEIGDDVIFSFSGNNCGTVFTLGIYKFGQRIDAVDVKGNTYSYKITEPGSYSAYMTSYNDTSFADSNWIEFEVLTEYVPVKTGKYNNNIYYVYNEKVSWERANEVCKMLGGHLITINNYNEDLFVKDLIQDSGLERYWLGGVKTDIGWEWITKEEFDYTNWYPGEPNDNASSEKYLEYYKAQGWNDNMLYKHNVTGGFVCEIESDISIPLDMEAEVSVLVEKSIYNVNVVVTNSALYDINGVAIFVYKYNDGTISAINTRDICVTSGSTLTLNDSRNISDIGENVINKAEVYIWDSINGMKPLAQSVTGNF